MLTLKEASKGFLLPLRTQLAQVSKDYALGQGRQLPRDAPAKGLGNVIQEDPDGCMG